MDGARFERDYGCTERDWLRWLPGAVREQPWQLDEGGRAQVHIGAGVLRLCWRALPPRQIAMVRMPRLAVNFEFVGVAAAEQQVFLRYFDLYMQRGGG